MENFIDADLDRQNSNSFVLVDLYSINSENNALAASEPNQDTVPACNTSL